VLFAPSRYPSGDWQPDSLKFEDVFFTSNDGTKLHGWYCPCEDSRAVVLLAHGNAGHIASRTPWLRYLQNEAQLSVFIFDYRGFGRSEGKPTVSGAVEDAMAARAKLRELAKVEDSEMILMGESLGGAIATQLAVESAPSGLILQSTFSSLRDVASVRFPSVSWFVPKDKLNSASQIGRYQGPLLQSHGSRDQIIPYQFAEKLFQAANEPKQFITIENADHNNWLNADYLKQMDEFIEKVSNSSK